MIRIGIAGIGFMGMTHYRAAVRLRGAAVTAVCSRDPKKLSGDWRGIRGNFGDPGDVVDLGSVKRYDRFDALLADPDIDLVDICSPPDQHEPMAVAALKAGKHVLVEKPISLQAAAAEHMVCTAQEAGRLLMVAHVLPFIPEFAYVAQVIRNGTHGKLIGAHFKRIISRPDWSAEIGDASKTGGPAIDLHIHDTHFIGLIAGVPGRVFSNGVLGGDGAVQYLTTQYLYGPGGPAISSSSGAVAMKSREFVHGFEVYLERATLFCESGVKNLTLLPAVGAPTEPALPGGDYLTAFAAELQTAVDGVAAGKEPDLLSGQLARDALILCHKEIESVKTAKSVGV
jgi:predicted dehydrogenase